MKKEEYPEFHTICYKCDKPLKTIQFHVHMGGTSFALCPKHLKELNAMVHKWCLPQIAEAVRRSKNP